METRTPLPAGYPTDTTTNPNNYVAEVNGASGGHKVGPGILLKVMAGDQFSIRASSWYRLNGVTPGTPASPLPDLLTTLISGIGGLPGGEHPSLVALNANPTLLSSNIESFLDTADADPIPSKPQAFVNWILFDNQFNYVGESSGFDRVGEDQVIKHHILTNLPVTKSGYLYIYTSNETSNVSVFFDNLQVTHTRGALLEENQYYPGGLTMAGISDKVLKAKYYVNKYRFNSGNEQQHEEFSDKSGLELYDAVHRLYDQQTGRFCQVDPLPQYNFEISPYAFANNDPISFNDPLGDTTTYPAVTVTAKKPLDTENGQVLPSQSWFGYHFGDQRVFEGHFKIGNLWVKTRYLVNKEGYITGEHAANLLTFTAPIGEKPTNLKAVFRLKNFLKARYLIYTYEKKGLPYIGKALGSLVARYGSEEKVATMGIRALEGLENIPNNAIALGVEQLVVDLNGGIEGNALANVNNPTIKDIYINEARYWLENNVPDWETKYQFVKKSK